MRTIVERLVMLMTALFVVSAVAQGGSTSALVAGVAVAVLAGVLAIRSATLASGARTLTVGSRARAHREALSTQPSPAHPLTQGRRRSRAPSQGVRAA